MLEMLRAHLNNLPAEPPEVNERSRLATSGQVSGCLCEDAASVHGAMGRVADGETLTYIIFYPSLNKKKAVPVSGVKAVSAKDFDGAYTRGLSVVRGQDSNQFSRAAAKLVGEPAVLGTELPERGVIGVATFVTEEVRNVLTEQTDERVFCVFDTPEEMDDPLLSREAHAEVMVNHSVQTVLHQEEYRIKVRNILYKLAKVSGDVRPVAEGALVPFCSRYAAV